jgi:membrane protease YdiL (CAAX protease family)
MNRAGIPVRKGGEDVTQLAPPDSWSGVGLWGPPVPRRTWGARDVAAGVGWLLGANLVLAVGVVGWMLAAGPDAPLTGLATNPVVLVAGLVTLWAVFTAVPVRVSRRYGTGSLSGDFGWRVPGRGDWMPGVKVGLVLRAADLALGWVALELGWAAGDNSAWLVAPRAWALTALFLLGAAVIAPALEELFFRGFVLRALARSPRFTPRASTVLAIAVSSVVFGALHTTALNVSGLYVVVVTAAAGAVLAVLATRRGNLGACIAAHIVFNSTGVIGVLLVGI